MNATPTSWQTRFQALGPWFGGLSARERRLVVWGGIGAVLLLLVGAVVMPLYAATAKAAQRVEQKQQDLGWMRSVAGELSAAGSGAEAPGAAGSLILLVDQSAQQTGLGPALTGSQPSGNGGLRVRLEQASFDALVAWLAMLERQHRITVESATVDRTAKPGIVNASVVFRK